MAAEKNITSRIQQKHDTAANWAKATTFIPKKGEIVVYDAEYNTSGVQTQAVRFKIGDGSRTINNLPFALIDYDTRIASLESTVNGLGTAAQKDVGFFATAAQGIKADNAVPKTRKVNNKALSADITLGASDVGVTETAFPGLKKTGTITGIKMNGASKGTSGVVDLGTVITDISGKLDKITYEVNKVMNFGSTGVLYVGRFNVYDTNITCEITSTTHTTYSGKLVIATQNYVIMKMTVYGDATNTVAPNFFIRPSSSKNDPYVEVYFKPAAYSKNVVHIYGSSIAAEPTNVCTSISAVPNTATSKPVNALTETFQHKLTAGTNINITNSTISAVDTGATSVEVTGAGNAVTAASYNATNRKLTLTKGSTFLTSHQDISGLMPKSGGTFTGVVTFNKQINLGQGDANCLYLGTDGRLNGPENRTLFGLVNGTTTFGHPAYALTFRGSGTRPKFNGNDLALKSDVPTFELSGDTLIINF